MAKGKTIAELRESGMSWVDVAAQLGCSTDQAVKRGWHEVDAANPIEAKPGTDAHAKAVVKLRDVEALRWERIATRAGISVKAVRELYTETTGTPWQSSYTGRGRRFEGMPEPEKTEKPKKAAKPRAKSAKAEPEAAEKPKPVRRTKTAAKPARRTRKVAPKE